MNQKMKITEENKYCTKDIAKYVRQTLKDEFKDLKISVTKESYSGGSSISVTILESKHTRFLRTRNEIGGEEILSLRCARNDTEEEVNTFLDNHLSKKHQTINQYHINSDWSLTEKGKEIVLKVLAVANKYNHDNSDAMTDYFDVNYYLDLNLGQWDKPFIDGVQE